MRTLTRLIFSMSLAILFSGCATQVETMTPEVQARMREDLKAGNLTLDCNIKCVLSWNQHSAAIHAMDVAEQWDALYVKVMQIGYREDLAYYYLGQAAQGLGYHHAAIKYYKYALALATGQSAGDKCNARNTGMGDPCQGVDIAAVAPVLIKASEDILAPKPAQASPKPVQAAPKAKPKAATSESTWTAPPPASGSSSGSTWTAPPPASGSNAGSTWTAPPPAPK